MFSGGTSFELSGDRALGVKIGDFDGGGTNDLLIYHEIGKTILYLGEDGFDQKIKYYGDEFNTLAQGIYIETEWDFNNDGLIDKVQSNGSDNLLYIAKVGGGYHYVPQKLPSGSVKFGDLNGDGLVDFASFSGSYASITYQTPSWVAPEPVPEPDPVVEPGPATVPDPVVAGDVPAVESNAGEVEGKATIAEIGESHLLLTSGKTLWFNSESIIKYNDAPAFAVGQSLEFKAWENSDGAFIAIKVEVM